MKITIETVPHKQQRYDTCGDWMTDAATGDITIRVSEELTAGDLGRYYFTLVGIHELVEAVMCVNHFIPEDEVTEWDVEHDFLPEPGAHPEAPYHDEHVAAEVVERLFAVLLGIEWNEYGKAVQAL